MTFKADVNKPTEYDGIIADSEKANGLPNGLLKLVMMIENRNDPKNRVSPKGASGVMQVMPSNFESLGITDPENPEQNIFGAGKLMAQLNKQYGGDVGAMLAHYNGGNRAASDYLAGKEMNPETTDYLSYAAPYFDFKKPSGFGRKMMGAATAQMDNRLPSDLAGADVTGEEELYTGMDASLDAQLKSEAQLADWSAENALKYGFGDTLTAALGHMASRENDPNFIMGDSQFEDIRKQIPNGLNSTQTDRLYNSRSQDDFQYNLNKTVEENDLMARVAQQDGWGKAGATAAIISGGLLDPVALPLSTFGAVGRVVRGANIASTVTRGAAEAAVVTGAISPIIQTADKGSWSGADVAMHMGAAAVFGAGISTLGRLGTAGAEFTRATQEATLRRMQGAPEYQPRANVDEVGTPINFRDAQQQSTSAEGSDLGAGVTEVHRAANAWDETVTPEMAKVQKRRDAWYNNPLREKVTGWSDSEGVVLARSKSKTARFLQAMWSGNAAGLGKQEARTAAVMKEQMLEQMQYETIPELKGLFQNTLDGKGLADYMAGGAKDQQAAFSRAVQLERYKHRMYRADNGGDSKGYVSDASADIQRAAKVLDDLYGKTKKMHMDSQTEHADVLAKEDSVGYIEQRPDFNKLVHADTETRKAFLDMVKDDYRAEATAKINNLRKERDGWMEAAYKRAEQDMEKPWVNEFLSDPNKYFDKHVSQLSKKLQKEMDRRASHWWDNALKDPETRYQNSEASLMTLAREMAGEWFTGKEVDADLVTAFQKSLTEKWSDTSRRELNMLNKRTVNGQELYMLDMFSHDVFGATTRTMNDTAGRVAMAKMGWKTEQDIADSIDAMRFDGATAREIESAKFISDVILNRAKGLDNTPLVQAASNVVFAQMMGKLPTSLIADLPTIIGNLGVGGMVDALGGMAKHVVDGSMFVKNGRPTPLGRDLEKALNGLTGHDHLLWVPQQLNADGMAMEAGGSILRRSAAAARFTATVSGANATARTIGTAVTKTTVDRLHKYFKTGKGLSEVRLQDVGLHPEQLGRIKEQFDLHSTDKDFGLDKWDARAREEFVSAAHRFTNQNRIDRSYAGEVPKWSRDNILGYLYSKFRIIGIRAQEKVLMRNVTIMDSNTVGLLTAGIAYATFMAYARIHLDAATSKDGAKTLKDRLTPWGVTETALRLSSVFGLGSEIGNLGTLLTGGGFQGSDTPVTGAIGNFIGAGQAVGKAVTGEGTGEAAVDNVFKALPGGNSYLMMGIKNNIK
ncbi:lytic transglycosylase, catalytic [Yersinia phage phiR8-01]|uniref:Lytic transglycosylase, catalytic n=1 Tax=Yersinia phage phiR8-01 TaxID=1206556 RepID=I7J3S3_9CAUD|nr:internal virion protein with endolysin domain [Yersinia phage phiR8-01]CCI88423.2 lytic transglycosylase, catalytic [Yersinia phage phiR8-01]